MKRYFIESDLVLGDKVVLKGELFHHIVDVCRNSLKSKFELITEDGNAHFGEIILMSKKEAVFEIKETRKTPTPRKPYIHLILSIPKLPTLEAVIEKSVEMGVSSIHLAFSDFSFFKNSQSFPTNKFDRWKKIVISATQQSGRGNLMQIQPAKPFKDCLKLAKETPQSLTVFAYEGQCETKFKDYVKTLSKNNIENVWIIVGSEGGFSDQEVLDLKSEAFVPVTLGDQILRVETACLTLVSALKYELDLL